MNTNAISTTDAATAIIDEMSADDRAAFAANRRDWADGIGQWSSWGPGEQWEHLSLADVMDEIESILADATGHECTSTTTPDGHGAYCADCGETLC
jgi:hypothetical protein